MRGEFFSRQDTDLSQTIHVFHRAGACLISASPVGLVKKNMTGSGVALEYATWTVVRHVPYCERGRSCRTSGFALEYVSHYSTFT